MSSPRSTRICWSICSPPAGGEQGRRLRTVYPHDERLLVVAPTRRPRGRPAWLKTWATAACGKPPFSPGASCPWLCRPARRFRPLAWSIAAPSLLSTRSDALAARRLEISSSFHAASTSALTSSRVRSRKARCRRFEPDVAAVSGRNGLVVDTDIGGEDGLEQAVALGSARGFCALSRPARSTASTT